MKPILKPNLKLIFYFFLILIPTLSSSQTFTGLNLNCYPVSIETNDTQLKCPLILCITQDIMCCSESPVQNGGYVYDVTTVTNCVTIPADGSSVNICFWEPDLLSYECGCTIIGTSITIKREGSEPETITIPSSIINDFLNILNGTSTTDLQLPSFQKDCNGQDYLNYVGLSYNPITRKFVFLHP